MNRMLPTLAALLSALTANAFAQAPTFAVSLDSVAVGTAVTTTNSNLTYVRNAGASPKSSTVSVMESSFDEGQKSIRLLSSGYSSTPNIAGIGVNSIASSSIYSLSVDITSALWQTGSWCYVMMGEWNTGSSNQVYNPGSTVTTTGYSLTTIGQQSLFALALYGSSSLNGAVLRTITATGSYADIKDSSNTTVVLTNGESYNLHIVANGSGSAITVGDDTIAAGRMGIYLDGTLVATALIADSVDANALRVSATGNSTGNLQTDIELANLQVWNSAVSPVPEAAATAALLGGAVLLGVVVRRRKAA